MKKWRILLLLLLPILLVSCARPHTFSSAEDGSGYMDQKTEIVYSRRPSRFEAASKGELFGTYVHEESGTTINFYEIPGMDSAVFLTDDKGNLYCSDAAELAPEEWTVNKALVCIQDSNSVALDQFTAKEDAATLAEICTLWFETESNAELPRKAPVFRRQIKLCSDEYPSLYLSFTFAVYEGDAAYFFDRESGRTVPVPKALVDLLYNGGDA